MAVKVISPSSPLGKTWFGEGYITGRVKYDGVNTARQVYLTVRDTKELVGVVFTGTDGVYSFVWVNPELEFDLRATDWDRKRADATLDAIRPKPNV